MNAPTQHDATKLIFTLLYCGCSTCGARLIDNGQPREGTLIDTDEFGRISRTICKACAAIEAGQLAEAEQRADAIDKQPSFWKRIWRLLCQDA